MTYGWNALNIATVLKFSFPAALLLIAALFGFDSHEEFDSLRAGVATISWPKADGVITFARIEPADWRTRERGQVHINYTYDVGGRAYHCSQIAFRSTLNNPTNNMKLLAAVEKSFQIGSHHKVFYSPDNPINAFLIPGIDEQGLSTKSVDYLLAPCYVFVSCCLWGFVNDNLAQRLRLNNKRLFNVASIAGLLVGAVITAALSGPIMKKMIYEIQVPVASRLQVSPEGYTLGQTKTVIPF
jgi:Protein of unknown function (DUF3592)